MPLPGWRGNTASFEKGVPVPCFEKDWVRHGANHKTSSG